MIARMLFTTAFVSVLGLTLWLMVRRLNPDWWKVKAVRWGVFLLPVMTLVSLTAWGFGFRYRVEWLLRGGSMAAAVCAVLVLGLILALPVSALLNYLGRVLERRVGGDKPEAPAEGQTRRQFLKASAVAVPVASVLMGKVGIASSFKDTRVYLRPMRFPDLPQDLAGLRILHLTDSHLGIMRFLPDVERLVESARRFRPDLVLLTGDIADDLKLLAPALKLIHSLNPRYGTFASLGNHEYSRGIDRVLSIFDKSPVELLRGSGRTVRVGKSRLYIAGADDPRRMHGDYGPFMNRTVGDALRNAPEGAFTVLMTHRPNGFAPAARRGVNLTLAGHTHGGQVGINGRSFWSHFAPDRYLWGEYRRGKSQMYLSAGIGHWFPFRLGCPPEAPVIELRS